MSVLGIDNARITLDTSQLSGSQQADGTAGLVSALGTSTVTGAETSASNAANDAASVDISKPAQIFQKLEKLKTQDPDKFKQIVSDIASKLKALSQQDQGVGGQFLSKLADKFQDVANGGDLSQLQPPNRTSGQKSGLHQAYGQVGQQTQNLAADLIQNNGKHPAIDPNVQSQLKSLFDALDQAVS